MIVQRLLPAFCCALSIHLLVILVPYFSENPLAPQLSGNKSIQINLASTSATNTTSDTPSDAQEEALVTPPPEQVETTEDSAEAIQKEPETIRPATIQAQPEKQLQQPETIATPSPKRIKNKHSDTSQTPSSQDSKTAKIAAAAKVTSTNSPIYYKNPKPAYPALARKRHWQGTVVLAILVLNDGTVGQVAIHKSSGHEMLDNSALKTVKTWRFFPGVKNGIPVSMEVQVPIHFKLD